MTEKSFQATVWSQFNMWSLTDVDDVPLTRLPVLGDIPCCSERNANHMSVSFIVIGNCAASALKFIDKVGL